MHHIQLSKLVIQNLEKSGFDEMMVLQMLIRKICQAKQTHDIFKAGLLPYTDSTKNQQSQIDLLKIKTKVAIYHVY